MIDHLCLLMVFLQSVSIWGTPKHGCLPAFHSQFYFVDVWLCSYLRWQEACSSWHECSGGHSNQQSLEPPHNSVFSSTLDKWQSSEITTCPLTAQGGGLPLFSAEASSGKKQFYCYRNQSGWLWPCAVYYAMWAGISTIQDSVPPCNSVQADVNKPMTWNSRAVLEVE